MENFPIISVIIPVHNKEECVQKTLESVLKQSYPKLQVIVVDDGSTDNSLKICNKYREKDRRVLVIHQMNRGVSSARNVGLENATGDWISFIDCGDYVEVDYYQKVIEILTNYNVDIICTGVYKDSGTGNFVLETKECIQKILLKEQAIEGFLKRDLLTISCYDKIYRRNIASEIRFDESITHNEDALFAYNILKLADKIALNPEIKYYYTYLSDSVSRRKFSKKNMSIVKAQNMIFEDAKLNFPELKEENVKNYIQSLLSCLSMSVKEKYDDTEDINLIRQKIKENVIEYFMSDAAMGYKLLVAVSCINLKFFSWII